MRGLTQQLAAGVEQASLEEGEHQQSSFQHVACACEALKQLSAASITSSPEWTVAGGFESAFLDEAVTLPLLAAVVQVLQLAGSITGDRSRECADIASCCCELVGNLGRMKSMLDSEPIRDAGVASALVALLPSLPDRDPEMPHFARLLESKEAYGLRLSACRALLDLMPTGSSRPRDMGQPQLAAIASIVGDGIDECHGGLSAWAACVQLQAMAAPISLFGDRDVASICPAVHILAETIRSCEPIVPSGNSYDQESGLKLPQSFLQPLSPPALLAVPPGRSLAPHICCTFGRATSATL